MDSKNLKLKKCQEHPSEDVIRMCEEYECNQIFCRGKCMFTDHESHQQQLLSIDDLIVKMLETFKQSKLVDVQIPQEYVDFEAREDEHLSNLTDYIDKEKKNVDDSIQRMLKLFDEICKEIKQKAFKKLDSRADQIKRNYQTYKTNLEIIYRIESANRNFSTRDNIIIELNKCNNLKDYESVIKEMNKIIYERQTLNEIENNEQEFINMFIQRSTEDIITQINLKPRPSFDSDGSHDKLIAKMKNSVKKHMIKYFSLWEIINPIPIPHILSCNYYDMKFSKIIHSQSESRMITNWISDGNRKPRKVKYTLLYRGSRDGYSYENVHSKIGSSRPTVTLVEATTGKRFGAFTDEHWTNDEGWKSSDYTFIFSISDQEVYRMIDVEEENSFNCSDDYLIQFGYSGIFLAIDGNRNTDNSCFFGDSCSPFDNKGKSSDSLAGSIYFQMKELEVYHVDLSYS